MYSQNSAFFELRQPYTELTNVDDFWVKVRDKSETKIEDFLYRPDRLESKEPPQKWMIRGKSFKNISFSKTLLSYLEFTDCTFNECLFVGSIVSDCRFNDCQFVNCNFFRAQFQNCFIDPSSFARCLDPVNHANIGVGLYQELLQNSRQQAQPEFSNEAQYQFRRWKRFLGWHEVRTSNKSFLRTLPRRSSLLWAWAYEKSTGSGTRFTNMAATSATILVALTVINYMFRDCFGLMIGNEPVKSIPESFYFSTIVVTTLGFGDITPRTDLGRIVVSLQALLGFATFAVLVSMAFRRMTN